MDSLVIEQMNDEVEARQDNEDTPAQEPEPEPIATSHTLIVDVEEFRSAFELAVTEKKTSIPVLSCLLVEPQESSVSVLSTDLDKWTITEVPAMIDDSAEPFLMPHRTVLQLLKGESGILKITSKVTKTVKDVFLSAFVSLNVGGCDYELPSMDRSNFPEHPEIAPASFSIPGSGLKTLINRTMFTISKEESRYTLNGALLECSPGKALMVATDGHRLALDSITVPDAPEAKALIPRDSLAWLGKWADSGSVNVPFGEDESFFQVTNKHTMFITKNLKGKFPDYRAVMPREDAVTVRASFPNADELGKTLLKVTRMADERSHGVRWSVNGTCTLSAQSCETGKASATVKASITHSQDVSEIAMGFNSDYVLDVLKVAGKNPIVLSLKDSQSAGMITVPKLDNFLYVIMPMRA